MTRTRGHRGIGPTAMLLLAVLCVVGSMSTATALGIGPAPASPSGSGAAGTNFTVWFNETGLPTGTNWSVELNGSTSSSVGPSIAFAVPNGSYPYVVGNVTGFETANRTGQVSVAGQNVTVLVDWTVPLYTVDFNETGLPAGTTWSVNLSGTVHNGSLSTIAFLEPNGSYSYQVGALAGYTVSNGTGTVTVAGANASVTLVWTQNRYFVNFTESGLPAGTSWSISLNGSSRSNVTLSTPSTISFLEPNGSYSYLAAVVPGYAATNASGSVTVSGAAVTRFLDWSRVLYSVTFTESGLALGTNWSVSLGGVQEHSTTSAILFAEPNGSYAYSVASVPGYLGPSPASGTVNVNGGAVTVGISFTQTYTVTFTESQLPTGTNWSVSLNGVRGYSKSTSIVFTEPNGSYPFAVSGMANYTATPSSGTVPVAGSRYVQRIAWTLETYLVTVQESGLPSGLTLSVIATTQSGFGVGGTNSTTTTTPSVATLPALPNGTYLISFGLIPGYHPDINGSVNEAVTISGSALSLHVPFVVTTYLAVFNEYGTRALNWSVTVRNSSGHQVALNWSFASTISIPLPNGSYSYSVEPPPQHTANYTPSFTIAGNGSTQPVYFDAILYNLTFLESGLPTGTTWFVVLNGSLVESTNTSSFTFFVKNGGYNYSLRGPSEYMPKPASGTAYVHSGSLNVSVSFVLVTYPVSFFESGLPSGAAWGVEVNSTWHYATGTSLSLALSNGTFSYLYSPVAGYRPNTTGGSFVVQGEAVQRLSYWSPILYLLTFSESGLPSPADWSLTFDGVTYSPNSTTFSLQVPNGTYPFSVTATGTFAGNPGSGWVTLAGRPVALTIVFARPPSTLKTLEKYLPYGLAGLGALVAIVLLLAYRRRRAARPEPPVLPVAVTDGASGPPSAGLAPPTPRPRSSQPPWSEDENEVLEHLQEKVRNLASRIMSDPSRGEGVDSLAADIRVARELLRSHRLEDAGRLLDQIERRLEEGPP